MARALELVAAALLARSAAATQAGRVEMRSKPSRGLSRCHRLPWRRAPVEGASLACSRHRPSYSSGEAPDLGSSPAGRWV